MKSTQNMNTERAALRSTDWLGREPSSVEIDDACLSYDHSYGLMLAESREKLRREAAEWLRAWKKTYEPRNYCAEPLPFLEPRSTEAAKDLSGEPQSGNAQENQAVVTAPAQNSSESVVSYYFSLPVGVYSQQDKKHLASELAASLARETKLKMQLLEQQQDAELVLEIASESALESRSHRNKYVTVQITGSTWDKLQKRIDAARQKVEG